jgi:hypothetical protein
VSGDCAKSVDDGGDTVEGERAGANVCVGVGVER